MEVRCPECNRLNSAERRHCSCGAQLSRRSFPRAVLMLAASVFLAMGVGFAVVGLRHDRSASFGELAVIGVAGIGLLVAACWLGFEGVRALKRESPSVWRTMTTLYLVALWLVGALWGWLAQLYHRQNSGCRANLTAMAAVVERTRRQTGAYPGALDPSTLPPCPARGQYHYVSAGETFTIFCDGNHMGYRERWPRVHGGRGRPLWLLPDE